MLAFPFLPFFLQQGFPKKKCGHNEKGYQILILEAAVSFAPLRPAGFVDFCGAGRVKECFSRGGAGQPVFGASISACIASPFFHHQAVRSSWRANKQPKEEDGGEGENDEKEIKVWRQTLPPPPHPIEGSYLQVMQSVFDG